MSTTTTTERAPAQVAARARTFVSRHSSLMPTFAALVIFVLLLVGAQMYFGNFATPRNMSALLLDNAYLVILAVGMTFVIVTGGIDLSVGSVMAFTGIWCADLLAAGHSATLVVPLRSICSRVMTWTTEGVSVSVRLMLVPVTSMRSRDCCAAASAATRVMLAAIAYATAAHNGFFVKLMETPDFGWRVMRRSVIRRSCGPNCWVREG